MAIDCWQAAGDWLLDGTVGGAFLALHRRIHSALDAPDPFLAILGEMQRADFGGLGK